MKNILFNKNYTCIAVSKTKPTEDILKIYNLGHKDFGENKVQELEIKHGILPKDINWHMIGHLQTNKVKKIVPFISLIHSVDSIKLLKVINKESKKINKITKCLIQVNISNEENKYGFKFSDLNFLNSDFLNDYKNIELIGLMGMASYSSNKLDIQKEFNLLNNKYMDLKNDLSSFSILSMGMSNDYELALSEGSNMIRVGSKIFGERNYH
ncbi:MAG: YggS family pyridoxal phosphate-dependent enzyme [Cytophagales bacterium]|nr:MAG: YggS family pyridoxal phosphate-dependent enzyme [Rhodothermaeota bacterium MED-G16]